MQDSVGIVIGERKRCAAIKSGGRIGAFISVSLPRAERRDGAELLVPERFVLRFNSLYSALEGKYISLAERLLDGERERTLRISVSYAVRRAGGLIIIERKLDRGVGAPIEPENDVFEVLSGRLIR